MCPARLSVARRTPGQTPMRRRRVSDGEKTRAVGAARHPPVTPASLDFAETVRILATTAPRWATVTDGLVDDLEGLEMTLEILGDGDAVARISESLAALGRGEPGADMATVRQDLARRRATGA